MKPLEIPTSEVVPNSDEISLARHSAGLIAKEEETGSLRLSLLVNETPVAVPDQLGSIIEDSLKIIADGHAVTVVPKDLEIGSQEAANLLGVSRPYLVKLLDTGAIPSRKVGVQRRVIVADLLAYRDREKAARRQALRELAGEGQRLGLGE
jgi:excisionase family DNA binding protein